MGNDKNEDTKAWDEVLNRKGGEDEIDGIHLKMEQTGTPRIAQGNYKSKVSSRDTPKLNRESRHRLLGQKSSEPPRKSQCL